jgi:SHS2 domain-containing protein
MDPAFELFDHTADMGIRVRAASLPELLAPARDGLYAVIGDLQATGPSEPVFLDLTGEDAAGLLRDYLAEVLTVFDRDARIVTAVDAATFTQHHLTATLITAKLDNDRSALHREVKAITYHGLDVYSIPDGYEATLIVDI